MKDKKTNITKTILTISVGFVLVYLATKWNWAILVSFVVGLIGIVSTYLSQKIEFLWDKLTWLLSLVVPNILLSAVFYLFLFPVSILSKLFGKKDPLRLRNKGSSVFVKVDKDFDKTSFEKPW